MNLVVDLTAKFANFNHCEVRHNGKQDYLIDSFYPTRKSFLKFLNWLSRNSKGPTKIVLGCDH